MFVTLAVARIQFGLLPVVPIWVAWVFFACAFLMCYALYVGAIFAARRSN